MSEVVLPALGESVTEGTVTRWLKNIGDRVEVDEPLLEVSTDKVDTEVPSPFAGILEEILVQEDETAEVGAILARIGDGTAAAAAAAPSQPAAQPAQSVSASQAPQAPAAAPAPQAAETSAAAPVDSSVATDGQDIVLPSLGESITEGTVTRWLKNVGDSVEVDEPLLEVSTDKVDTEVPSPIAGILQEILVQEDETVEVGGVLARIGSGSASPTAQPAAAAPVVAPAVAPAPVQAPAPVATPVPVQAPAQMVLEEVTKG